MTALHRIALSILAALGFAAALAGQTPEALTQAIAAAPGWRASGAATVVTARDIDGVVDAGLAQFLKSYGFDSMTTGEWEAPSGRVRATLYRMADSSASYGLFSIRRTADAVGYQRFPVGAEGYRLGRQATFWSGRYVIELEGDELSATRWAEIVAPLIDGPSIKPPVTEQLPVDQRIPDTEQYIVGAAGIAPSWGVDASLLGFDQDAEAATARYRIGGKTVQLLLLTYPTQQLAKKYEELLARASGATGRLQRRAGPLLAFADGAGDNNAAAALLDVVRHEFQLTWNEPPPPPNAGVVMMAVFRLAGLLMAMALATGITLGGIRIYVKWRHPDRVFDRSADMDVIQLNLNHRFTDLKDGRRRGP